jgi:hypothetical protein
MSESGNALDPKVLLEIQDKINTLVLRGLRFILESSAFENRVLDILGKDPSLGFKLSDEKLDSLVHSRILDALKESLTSEPVRKAFMDAVRNIMRESGAPEGTLAGLDASFGSKLNEIKKMMAPETLRNRLRTVTREELEERLSEIKPVSPAQDGGYDPDEVVATVTLSEEFNVRVREIIDDALCGSSGEALETIRSSVLLRIDELKAEFESRLKKGGIPQEFIDEVIKKVLENLSITFGKLESALRQKIEKVAGEVRNHVDGGAQEIPGLQDRVAEELKTALDALKSDLNEVRAEVLNSPAAQDKISRVVNEQLSTLSLEMMNQVQLTTLAALEPAIVEKLEYRLPSAIQGALKTPMKEAKAGLLDDLDSVAAEAVKQYYERELPKFQERVIDELDKILAPKLDAAAALVQNNLFGALTTSVEEQISRKNREDIDRLKEELRRRLKEELSSAIKGVVADEVKESSRIQREKIEENLSEKILSGLETVVAPRLEGVQEEVSANVNRNLRGVIDRLTGEMRTELLEKIENERSELAGKIDIERKTLAEEQAKERTLASEKISRELSRALYDRLFQDIEGKLAERVEAEVKALEGRFSKHIADELAKQVNGMLAEVGEKLESRIRDKAADAASEAVLKKFGQDMDLLPASQDFVSKQIAKEFGLLGNVLEKHFEQKVLTHIDEYVDKKIVTSFAQLGEQIEEHVTAGMGVAMEKMMLEKLEDMVKADKNALGVELVQKIGSHVEKNLLEKVSEIFDRRFNPPTS